MTKITVAEVWLWGSLVGYVSWNDDMALGAFEYADSFLDAPVEISPLKMKKAKGIFTFNELDKKTYKGLPGLLSDTLPDKYGSALIDVWLSQQGRSSESFSPIERLCYIGNRGMGALEFKPSHFKLRKTNVSINIADMVDLASQILSEKETFTTSLEHSDDKKLKESLTNLLVLGTSAGGARAKCLIAYNEKTKEIKSGQIKTSDDFSYWLLKLDGVNENKDKELADPKGFGKIEYAYYLMAKDCGIDMSDCQLFQENGRAHFMTKRFDRRNGGEKIHMQSLCALAHYDFNMPGAYSYEQALQVIRDLVGQNTSTALEQQFLRAIFNVIGRNQDDHTKNIAFLMDKSGNWNLSPAFDIAYSYNPKGQWTSQHQMSLNGKRDHFILDDLVQLGLHAGLKKTLIKEKIQLVLDVVSRWSIYASKAGVSADHQIAIAKNLRLNI